MGDLRILSHWAPATPFPCLFPDAQPMLVTDTSFFQAYPVAVSCRCLSSPASVVTGGNDGSYVLHVLINRGPPRLSPKAPCTAVPYAVKYISQLAWHPGIPGYPARLGH